MSFWDIFYRFKSQSKEQFEKIYGKEKDPWQVETSDYEIAKQNAVLKIVSERRYKNALDIGCGIGILTRILAPFCEHITGMDFSQKAIEVAQDKCKDVPNVSFILGDIRNIPENIKYDLFICSEVLNYLTYMDIKTIITAIRKLSMPNSALLLVGKQKHDSAFSMLKKEFPLLERHEESNWDRPFAVSLFQINHA